MQFKNLIAVGSSVVLLCLTSVSAPAQTYKILHTFGTNVMERQPGPIIQGEDGTLYGTTYASEIGVLYKINNDGSGYTVLRFDSFFTGGGLVLSGTTLYGKTYFNYYGTIFKINTDGSAYRLLRQFVHAADGAYPVGGLTLSSTTLYGTLSGGGANDGGLVFGMDTDGSNYSVLMQCPSDGEGAQPAETLLLSDTNLYGTTDAGSGTIFKIGVDGGNYRRLAKFPAYSGDGSGQPRIRALSGATLYGTTSWGTPSNAGEIFKLNTDGTGYGVLKQFTGGVDGRYPWAGVVISDSTLFGTAREGGLYGEGVVFKVNTNGSGYTVIKHFSGSDGANPSAGLVLSGTRLYGTTQYGGNLNNGVLFSLSIAPPTIVTSMSNQMAEVGHIVYLAVYAIGDPVLTYLWYLNGTNFVACMTNNWLELSSVQLSQSGAYSVIVTNLFGAATSSPALLNVIAVPPTILRHPVTQSTELGSDFGLSVKVDGSFPLSYQWYCDSTNLISDATDSGLLLTNVQFRHSGAYTVVVTNLFGAVTSAPAMLNVIAAVERRPIPGVKVAGENGSMLNLDYANSLSPAPNWAALGSVNLTSTSQLYFDLTTPLPSQRFYRAWQTGTPSVVPSLNLNFVPAITLTGNVGDSLRLDYINAIGPTDAWVTLDTVTLTNTSQLYFDISAPGRPTRLYRIVPVP